MPFTPSPLTFPLPFVAGLEVVVGLMSSAVDTRLKPDFGNSFLSAVVEMGVGASTSLFEDLVSVGVGASTSFSGFFDSDMFAKSRTVSPAGRIGCGCAISSCTLASGLPTPCLGLPLACRAKGRFGDRPRSSRVGLP